MTEAKYELINWTRWKRTIQLLEEIRNQCANMKQGIDLNLDEMSDGKHKSINQKFNRIIEQREQYDEIIKEYNFFINRLEKVIATLLSEEQRDVCIIYANCPNNSKKRDFEAIRKGYTRTTYYEVLNDSINILNKYFCVLDNRKEHIDRI